MKLKTKIAVAITSLMVTTYHTEPSTSPVSPQIAPVSEVVEMGKAYTPPTATEAIVAEKIEEINTQIKEIIEPTNQQEDVANVEETPPTQPTGKPQSTNIPTPPTQTAKKPTATTQTTASTPKNGDTRIVNGQQQGYLIGFGWVDHMGENTCTTDYGMYENSNKIGTMGDINKIVGSMD